MIVANVDATPERFQKGDPHDLINPATIDSAEQPIGLTRRFLSSHIDRLYKNDRLTWVQWYAADWYRRVYEQAGIRQRTTANYQGKQSHGEPAYGLPNSEKQYLARRRWMEARKVIPVAMVGYVDRLVLHDEMPRYGGRASVRSIQQLASALDCLAFWLKMPANR